ncbi:MAG: hypothetical protein KDA58_08720, partial [Planctomycetaceae bacterium]|nr:hypothetical protein [Planctomycetaceae bacterium]
MTFSHLFRTRLLFGALLLVVGSDTMLCAQTGRETKRKAQQSAEPSIVWVNELPDGKELPSGVSHRTFPSQAAGRQVGYCIYLPPQYESEPDRRFPVIYNLHGNGGNEFHSFEDVAVLDAGIRSGRWPALIMVLPNGGKSTFYKDSHDGQFPIETVFIRELIPHIDAEFRT